MTEKTTIQVYTTTRELLKDLGERGEDYDSIINRAISGEFAGQGQVKKQKKAEAVV